MPCEETAEDALGVVGEPAELIGAIRTAPTSGAVAAYVAEAWARGSSAALDDGDGAGRLLAQLRRAEVAAQERRDRQHHTVSAVLLELADHGSTRSLVEAAPDALRRLGFVTSTVTWLDGDAGTRPPGQAGHGDADVVRRRSSVLVPRHVESAAQCPVEAHIAAPIIVDDTVVAILHAGDGQPLDETDRHVVAAFAGGLGHLLARNRHHDELAALQGAVKDVIDRATWPQGARFGRPLGGGPAPAPPAVPCTRRGSDGPLGSLTPREVETLGHLAAGHTNARIARRLVISEGTVKSHVKSLLRKLGAANRAEAVSIWHRSGHGGSPRG